MNEENHLLIRRELDHKRKALSSKRRNEAAIRAFDELKKLSGIVLSFASFGAEIDLWRLNRFLALHKRLVLPRVEGENLKLYLVEDVDLLVKSNWGIWEPNPEVCKAALHVDYALVPGLCFDDQRNRIGYGKGHYDRLLPHLDTITIGVGFKEQLIRKINTNPWDYSLEKLSLF